MSAQPANQPGPHQGQPVYAAGVPLESAAAAMILVHGRGARAHDILMLSDYLSRPGLAFLAPQAANNTWYPNRFLVPLESNEPWLTSALERISEVHAQVISAGIPSEKVFLLGFSQGACLALEYAARNARRYGGVAGLSGALIGPPDLPRNYLGSFDGMPLFLGCSNIDFHVPEEYVHHSAKVFEGMGAQVTTRIYPKMDHSINQDEIDFVNQMLAAVIPD